MPTDLSNLQGYLNILKQKKNEQQILAGIKDETERKRFATQLDIDAREAAKNLIELQKQGEEFDFPFEFGVRRELTQGRTGQSITDYANVPITLEDLAAGNFTGFTIDIGNVFAGGDVDVLNKTPGISSGAPTGEQGSRANILKVRSQLPPPKPFTPSPLSVQNPEGIDYGEGKAMVAPFRRGTVGYGEGTPTGYGAGIKTQDGAFTTVLPKRKKMSVPIAEPEETTPVPVTEPKEETPVPVTEPKGETPVPVTEPKEETTLPEITINPDLLTGIQSAKDLLDQMETQFKADSPSLYAAYVNKFGAQRMQMKEIEDSIEEMKERFAGKKTDTFAVTETERLGNLRKEENAILDKVTQWKLKNAEIAKEEAELVRKKTEIFNDQAIQSQKRLNIENEIKLRNQLAAFGTESTGQGLKAMADAMQRGEDKVQELLQLASIEYQQASIPIIKGYQNEVNGILNAHETGRLLIKKDTDDRIAEIMKQANLDADKKEEKYKTELKKEEDAKNKLELDSAQTLIDAEKEMDDRMKDEKSLARTRNDAIQKQIKDISLNFPDSPSRTAAINNLLNELQESGDPQWEVYKNISLNEIEKAEGREIRADQKIKMTFDTQTSLRKEITDTELYKSREKISNSLDRLEVAIVRSTNPDVVDRSAADQTLIVSFNKMLDEGSVVREAEYDRTIKGQVWYRWLQGTFERYGMKDPKTGEWQFFKGGTTLTDEERKEMLIISQGIKEAMDRRWREELDHYSGIIKDWNERFLDNPLNPDTILRDYIPKHIREGKTDAKNWYEKNRSMKKDVPEDMTRINTQVLSGIIRRNSPYNPNGLDIAAPRGTPIMAPIGIEITKVINKYDKGYPNDKEEGKKQNGGWGNQVIGRLPDGRLIAFNHLQNIKIKLGDTLNVGDEIGEVGNTGLTLGETGYHLDISMFDENGNQLPLQTVWDFIRPNYIALK